MESGHVELSTVEPEVHEEEEFEELSDVKFIDISDTSTGRGKRKWLVVSYVMLVICLLVWAISITIFWSENKSSNSGKEVISWAPLPRNRISRIAFGSCAEQAVPQPYWDTVRALDVDLLILGGDNVYGDCLSEGCPELKAAYNELATKPSFAGAKPVLPILTIWDDHDYGKNDGYASNNPYKHFAKEQFLNFFDIHDERRAHLDRGLQKAYWFGDLQIILLDTRWYRSAFNDTDEPYTVFKERYQPSYEKDRTMLGEEQWQWFERQLQEPASLRIIVSTIQVIADGHGWECWRMFPYERDRLYALLNQYTEANGKDIIILSGDRHVGGFYKYQDDTSFFLYEATASSWTHTMPTAQSTCDLNDPSSSSTCDEPGPLRLHSLVRADNFVSVEIDWPANELTLSIRRAHRTDGIGHHNNAAEVLQSIPLSFSSS